MIDKLKKLTNPRAWIEGVLFRKVLAKGAKVMTAVVLGLISAPKVAPALAFLEPLFKELKLTPEEAATALVAFGFGALANWIKRVMEKPVPVAPAADIKIAA